MEYIAYVAPMHWQRIGTTITLHWRCIVHALLLHRLCNGSVSRMQWTCKATTTRLHGPHIGFVSDSAHGIDKDGQRDVQHGPTAATRPPPTPGQGMIWPWAGIGLTFGLAAGSWLRLRRYLPDQPDSNSMFGWRRVLIAAVLLALSCAAVAWRLPADELSILVPFLCGGHALVWIDMDCQLLPNWLTWPMFTVLTGIIIHTSWATSSWEKTKAALLCAGALAGIAWCWAVLGPLGLGDVKLALSIGLVLGHLGGWRLLVAGGVWIILLGGAWAAALLAAGHDRNSHLPYGPAMMLGALTACLVTSGTVP